MIVAKKHRAIGLSTIATLAVLSIFAGLLVWNKQPTTIMQSEATTASQPIGLRSMGDTDATIPSNILQQLEMRFQEIHPTMGEADVLETLRLDTYSKYLADHHRFQMDGGGHNHKFYVLPDGYRLEFKDWLGHGTECILQFPGNPNAKTARISERVSDMAGFYEYLNSF